jgi:hypothetical protein
MGIRECIVVIAERIAVICVMLAIPQHMAAAIPERIIWI